MKKTGIKSYGSVRRVIEAGCHRFESRFYSERAIMLVGGVVSFAGAAVLLGISWSERNSSPSVFALGMVMVSIFVAVGLWVVHVCFAEARLELTPSGFRFRRPRPLPFLRFETWSGPLSAFQTVSIEESRNYLRRSGTQIPSDYFLTLTLTDREEVATGWKLDSLYWAEDLQSDIAAAFAIMASDRAEEECSG